MESADTRFEVPLSDPLLTSEVLGSSALIIRRVELGSRLHGRFEVTLDGDLAFSKAAVKRLSEAAEVVRIFE